jgi:hypothetical protein
VEFTQRLNTKIISKTTSEKKRITNSVVSRNFSPVGDYVLIEIVKEVAIIHRPGLRKSIRLMGIDAPLPKKNI